MNKLSLKLRKFHPSIPAFLIAFITMFYGRLSVVMFIPQYGMDLGLSSESLSAYFTVLAAGTAVSNLASIYLFYKLSPKRMFYFTGFLSIGYELVLFFWPTSEGFFVAGALIGLAAGGFWSLLYILMCRLIDEHRLRANSAFSAYNAVHTIIGAFTPLLAGVIIVISGYPLWIFTALAVLVFGLVVVYMQRDIAYQQTFSKHSIREDIQRIVHDRRAVIAFILIVLFSCFSLNTWPWYGNVFRVYFGIRDYWLGFLAIAISTITAATYFLLLRRRRQSRLNLVITGLLVMAVEMAFLILVSDTTIIFLLEGLVGAFGHACYIFATQSLLKNTFEERIYIGRPIFFALSSTVDTFWLGIMGWVITSMGGYNATAVVFGITFQAAGLRVLLMINVVVLLIWTVAWWRLERNLVDDDELA